MNIDRLPRRASAFRTDRHASGRTVLRVLGFTFVLVGAVFALIGLVDFFSAFGSFHPPTLFWCAFVGLPLVAFGVMMLKAGYLGAMARYVADETVPVARDSAVDLAEGLRPTIRGIASDLREDRQPAATVQPSHEDPAVRLARLDKLRKDGLVTEAEYAGQRARILGEL